MRLLPNLLAALSGYAFTVFAVGVLSALQNATAQGWSDLGFDWLTLDAWSRLHESKEGMAGGAVTLVLACTADLLPPTFLPALWVRKAVNLFSKPLAWLVLLACAYLLPPALASATQPDAPKNAPNILFVLVDTWRADHAGFLGYARNVSPGLDALTKEGAIFEAAVAQSGWTKPTVATLFTGLVPSAHGAVSQPIPGMTIHGTKLPPDRTTFVEIFRAHGWDTAMWSNNPNILPTHGFGQGAGYFRSFVGESVGERFDAGRAEWMLPEVETWLASRDENRPFCAYVHIMDPHYPYVAPKPFAGTFDQSGLDFQLDGALIGDYLEGRKEISDVTPAMLQRILDIYDEELLYVDHYLTPFLRKVRKEHPNTLIVLVGDHGEEFLEHGQFGHGHSIYEELVHVPLVLWGPGIPAQRQALPARQMDVLPTLMELAEIRHAATESKIHGSSLVDILHGKETVRRNAPMESGGDQRPPWHWRGISNGEWKVILREKDLPCAKIIPILSEKDGDSQAPWTLLFHLTKDSGELQDLSAQNPALLRQWMTTLEQSGWLFPPTTILQLGTSDGNIGADLELLKELGYIDADAVGGQ